MVPSGAKGKIVEARQGVYYGISYKGFAGGSIFSPQEHLEPDQDDLGSGGAGDMDSDDSHNSSTVASLEKQVMSVVSWDDLMRMVSHLSEP